MVNTDDFVMQGARVWAGMILTYRQVSNTRRTLVGN